MRVVFRATREGVSKEEDLRVLFEVEGLEGEGKPLRRTILYKDSQGAGVQRYHTRVVTHRDQKLKRILQNRVIKDAASQAQNNAKLRLIYS